MDYPTMLYLGGLDSHAIAHDDDEAKALKAKGYVEHSEAVKIEPKQVVVNSDDTNDQLAEAYEHIEMLEAAIEVKDKEILELKGNPDGNNKRIKELEVELAGALIESAKFESELKHIQDKLAIYELAKDKNGNGKIDYDEMTNAELHKLLDERKADYNKRDGKEALIKAATDSE